MDDTHIQPLHTKVEKLIQTSDGTIVLESHSGYPISESNLYLLNSKGSVVWYAEKPETNTLFSRIKLNEDFTISTYTINGNLCDLDMRTGKILSQSKL